MMIGDRLRHQHLLERETEGQPITQATYPDSVIYQNCLVDWEDRPNDRFIFPITSTKNPFGEEAIGCVEIQLANYNMCVQGYPEWSRLVGVYPVPAELNELSFSTINYPYCRVEQEVGGYVLFVYDVVLPIIPLRAYCISQLQKGYDPRKTIKNLPKTVENITLYISGIARRMGVEVPKEPIPEPKEQEIDYPWEPIIPDVDEIWSNGNYNHSEYMERVDVPMLPSHIDVKEILTKLRQTIDPNREKNRVKKSRK